MKSKIKIALLICATVLVAGCGKKNDESLLDKGLNAVINQDYNGALGYFNEAVSNGDVSEDIYRGMGLAYMGQEDYAKAISCFKSALSNAGMFPGAMEYDINYYVAVCYFKLGDFDSAVSVYDSIINLNPKDEQAYFLRGSMKLYMSDLDGAIEDFDKATTLNKNNYSLYLDVYGCMIDHGYNAEAQRYLDVVMAADENRISGYDKGRLCYYQGEYAQGCNYLENAKKEDRTNKDIINLLSECYKANGQYDYAAVIYSTYLTEIADPEMYNQLGICYVQQGDYTSALAAFQSGLAVTENNTCIQTLMLNEIACYEYLLDFASAREKLGEYMTIYPTTPELEKEYAFLTTR